ncbi:MAG: TonB-dependent receptor [Thermoanaerobaculales bacterium]|nr:TonB-dependent receptor [Thermoanaerobaculales bacterium]
MCINNFRWRRAALLCGVLITTLGLIGYSPAVMAQEEAVIDEAVEAAIEKAFEEEISVTGTLIPRPTLEALSPVTVLGPEEITYSGVTRIEDLVATLPQAFAGQNSTWANGASGTASVSLRDLGTNRTLVLLNGRRLAPGSAEGTYAPDLNFIPGSMLKRVDVLTGGASAVYGTDAVAGVVNFILDTDFEGMRGDIQFSFYNHDNSNALAQEMNDYRGFDYPTGTSNDGNGINVNLAFGGKFADGRGHASAYIGYRKLDEVTKGMRDYLNCSAWATEGGPLCGGSATTDRGTFILDDGSYGMIDPTSGDMVPWDGYRFNYGPYNHIQRPDERWNAGAFVNYEFNEHAEGYIELMFMNDYTDAQIAPSGDFGVTGTINCDNPMLSEQQREYICGQFGYTGDDIAPMVTLRRNVEGEGRSNAIRHTSFRFLAGVRGDINDQWSYDLYGLFAQTNNDDSYNNDLNIDRIVESLDVIVDPDSGEWVCRSGGDCVPWNIFTPGAVDQAAIDYMTTVAVMYGTTRTKVANMTFTGDLEDYGMILPGANSGVQVAVGAEWRQEHLSRVPDEVYLNGAAAGFGGPTQVVDGTFDVSELFVEMLVPIMQDASMAHDLSMELGYRYSDYSTSGGASTYKAMLSWAPTPSFGFRGGYNRALRSANIFELFRPQGFNLGGSEDICAGPNPTATAAECANTGVTAGQYGNVPFNPAGQYNTLEGGNPLLEPETADTMTFGMVITPEGLPGFTATLDYYDIQIEDTIGSLSYNDILTQCARTGDPDLCSPIHRGPTGDLWYSYQLGGGYVETSQQNIGQLYAEGVDLSLSYMFAMGNAGFLSTDLTGTYVLSNRFANPLVDYDCVGYFGFQCGQPQSEWRHRARITWETNFKAVFSLAWRYIGSAENDDYSPDDDLRNEGNFDMWEASGSNDVSAFSYFDLSGTYNFSDSIQFTLGINNLADKEPPMWPDLQDDQYVNTYATYDPLGRYVHTSLKFTF